MKEITVNTYEMSDIQGCYDKFLYYDIIGSKAGF